MKVSLPPALEAFVNGQISSGEFEDVSDVVQEALRLFREKREDQAIQEMQHAFAGVNSAKIKGEPTASERALIRKLIESHRFSKRRE